MNSGLKYGAGIGAGLGGIKWLTEKDENKNIGSLAANVGGGAAIGGGVGYGISRIGKRAGATSKPAPRAVDITDDSIDLTAATKGKAATETPALPALPASTEYGKEIRRIRRASKSVETTRTEDLSPNFKGDAPSGSETFNVMGVDKRGAANPGKKMMGADGTYRGKMGKKGDKSDVQFFDPYSIARLWWSY